MMWIVGLVAFAFVSLIASHAAMGYSLTPKSGGSVDPAYSFSVWSPLISALITTKYPRVNFSFAKAWGEIESGWNPCAYGDPPPDGTADDGNPKEIGLCQIYNPDDFTRLKLSFTPSSMRAYCVPGTQKRNRQLTSEEMTNQVIALLAKIDEGIDIANETIAKYSLPWQGVDFWTLVKAKHAYPPILNSGMPAVVKKLGGAPRSWAEYRQTIGMDDDAVRRKALSHQPLTPEERVKWTWMRAMDACETCGNATAGGDANV